MVVLEVADERFCKLMEHIRVASSCRHWARREPPAARGLNRCADHHSALAAGMLTEMMAGRSCNPSVRPPQ